MNRRQQISRGSLLIYFALLLTGCTMISVDRKPPADWPKLEVSIVKLGFLKTQQKCGGNILMQTFACAEIRFDMMTCTIWTSTDDVYVVEHELAHCEGHEHVGSSHLSDVWDEWKKYQRTRVAQ